MWSIVRYDFWKKPWENIGGILPRVMHVECNPNLSIKKPVWRVPLHCLRWNHYFRFSTLLRHLGHALNRGGPELPKDFCTAGRHVSLWESKIVPDFLSDVAGSFSNIQVSFWSANLQRLLNTSKLAGIPRYCWRGIPAAGVVDDWIHLAPPSETEGYLLIRALTWHHVFVFFFISFSKFFSMFNVNNLYVFYLCHCKS